MWSSLLIQNRLCTSPYKRKSRGVKSSDLAGHSIVSIGPIHSPEEEMSSYNFWRKISFRCEDCNRDFKNEKGLKTHRRRIRGLMGQLFLCKSFSSKINKTRRKNEEIDNTPSTSMDYEKHFGSQDSHSSGSQRLPFKDNTTLQIHVNKYHINNALSTFSSTDSITKLLINLKYQLPTIRRLPKACGHLAEDKLSSIINNCSREI
jgi:hypothetical protein